MKKLVAFLLALSMVLPLVSCDVINTLNTSKKFFSNDPDAMEAASNSVVQLFVYDKNDNLIAKGSGFIAFDSQTIITNYHVIEYGYKIEFSGSKDTAYEVSSIYNVDKENDIAILQFENAHENFIPLTIDNSKNLKKGENVVAIGNPLSLKNTISKGSISNFIEHDGIEMIQFTAPISIGSSGGALFDDNGNIIGITTASYIDGQNLNLAIPSSHIISLYDKQPISTSIAKFYEENYISTVVPGVLTIGTTGQFPPFSYTDPAGLTGFEIDILKAIAQEIGLEIEFKEIEFHSLLSTLEAGEVDCIADGLTFTPERLQCAIATNPVAPIPMDLIPAHPEIVMDMSDVVFYITKNNVKLQVKFNEAIYKFQNDGTFVEIFEEYGIEYKSNNS